MSNRVLVSAGVGGWYPRGVARLAKSAAEHGCNSNLDMITSWREGVTPHEEVGYRFKADMVCQQSAPVRLWLDASFMFIRNPEPLWETLEDIGVLLVRTPHMLARWTSQDCLDRFGISDDKAKTVPMVAGGIFGVDARGPVAREFLAELKRHAVERTHFMPAADGRHRQDMSVMSCIAYKMGLPRIEPKLWAWSRDMITDDTVVYSEGM